MVLEKLLSLTSGPHMSWTVSVLLLLPRAEVGANGTRGRLGVVLELAGRI